VAPFDNLQHRVFINVDPAGNHLAVVILPKVEAGIVTAPSRRIDAVEMNRPLNLLPNEVSPTFILLKGGSLVYGMLNLKWRGKADLTNRSLLRLNGDVRFIVSDR
jgi:hypothetical protein